MAAARALLAALASVQLVAVDAAVAADEVQSLPGWNGALPSRHYSGYVDVSADGAPGRFLHVSISAGWLR